MVGKKGKSRGEKEKRRDKGFVLKFSKHGGQNAASEGGGGNQKRPKTWSEITVGKKDGRSGVCGITRSAQDELQTGEEKGKWHPKARTIKESGRTANFLLFEPAHPLRGARAEEERDDWNAGSRGEAGVGLKKKKKKLKKTIRP